MYTMGVGTHSLWLHVHAIVSKATQTPGLPLVRAE